MLRVGWTHGNLPWKIGFPHDVVIAAKIFAGFPRSRDALVFASDFIDAGRDALKLGACAPLAAAIADFEADNHIPSLMVAIERDKPGDAAMHP